MNTSNSWQSDSNSYRRIFEFIQKNGVDPLFDLVYGLDKISHKSSRNLIDQRLLEGKDTIGAVLRKNKVAVAFLRQFRNGILLNTSIFDEEFKKFITDTSKTIDKLDLYIENTKVLEELKIGSISYKKDDYDAHMISVFSNGEELGEIIKTQDCMNHEVYYREAQITDIIKPYSDAEIAYGFRTDPVLGNGLEQEPYMFRKYEDYGIKVLNYKWVIIAENHASGEQYRYAHLTTFDFDATKLPTEEELASYRVPQGMNEYRKGLILTKSLPF